MNFLQSIPAISVFARCIFFPIFSNKNKQTRRTASLTQPVLLVCVCISLTAKNRSTANTNSPFGRECSNRTETLTLTLRPNSSLPPGEMSRSDREGLYHLSTLRDLPDANLLEFTLSVICFANASSPRGRAKKPVHERKKRPAGQTHGSCSVEI